MSQRLEFALRIAEVAGQMALSHFQRSLRVHYKADNSPVTEADREVEAFLRREISNAYPGEAILGEEEGLFGAGDSRWILDPIDGTKSFICGVPLWAVLISFERDGVPEIGVCAMPAVGEVLYAERGSGAFWNGSPCRASDKTSLERAVICCGGHRNLDQLGRLDGVVALSKECMATRTWCDAYGHALVATGRVEAMIDALVEPYDISAMSLIVSEAGGRCTDFEGREWPKTTGISTNGHLHEAILGAFR